jgi:hypothetical protein
VNLAASKLGRLRDERLDVLVVEDVACHGNCTAAGLVDFVGY